MKTITVKHEVSPGRESCEFGGDFWGKEVCKYHTYSNPWTKGSAGIQKAQMLAVRLLA